MAILQDKYSYNKIFTCTNISYYNNINNIYA